MESLDLVDSRPRQSGLTAQPAHNLHLMGGMEGRVRTVQSGHAIPLHVHSKT